MNTVIFIDAALNISLNYFENVMFYDFIYLAKGFRTRPKVRSTLNVVYLSEITVTTFTFRDRTADVTYCADVTLFSARDVRRPVTDGGIFSPPIFCVLLL